MYKWCAYCQKFRGEVAPFDEHLISHGICENCKSTNAMNDAGLIEKASEIKRLFSEMTESVSRRQFTFVHSHYLKLRALSVSNSDIFSGLYQPLLSEIGRLWESRSLTVAEEHQITSTIEELVSLGFSEIPNVEQIRSSNNPEVFVTSISQNRHVLGLRLVEYWLCEHGIKNQIIVPGLTPEAIVQRAIQLNPKIVGLSVSLPHPDINFALNQLVEQTRGMKIVIGGRYVREFHPKDLPPTVEICYSIGDLLKILIDCKLVVAS